MDKIHNSHNRDDKLDAVKGVLILLIVLEHNHAMTELYPAIRPLTDSFVVGAFLMLIFVRQTADIRLSEYISKHFRYLIPYFFLCAILSVMNYVMYRPEPIAQFIQTVGICIFWQSVESIKMSTGLMLYWFLPCLCFLHFLRYLHLKTGSVFVALMFLAHVSIGFVDEDTLLDFPFSCHPALYIYFVGWLFGKYHKQILNSSAFSVLSSIVFLVLLIINHIFPYELFMAPGLIPDLSKPHLLVYYALILFFSIPGIYSVFVFLPKLFTKFFAFFGKHSFWIYIYHQVIFIFIAKVAKIEIDGFVSYLMTVSLSIVFAVISNRIVFVRDIVFPSSVESFISNVCRVLRIKGPGRDNKDSRGN